MSLRAHRNGVGRAPERHLVILAIAVHKLTHIHTHKLIRTQSLATNINIRVGKKGTIGFIGGECAGRYTIQDHKTFPMGSCCHCLCKNMGWFRIACCSGMMFHAVQERPRLCCAQGCCAQLHVAWPAVAGSGRTRVRNSSQCRCLLSSYTLNSQQAPKVHCQGDNTMVCAPQCSTDAGESVCTANTVQSKCSVESARLPPDT